MTAEEIFGTLLEAMSSVKALEEKEQENLYRTRPFKSENFCDEQSDTLIALEDAKKHIKAAMSALEDLW